MSEYDIIICPNCGKILFSAYSLKTDFYVSCPDCGYFHSHKSLNGLYEEVLHEYLDNSSSKNSA